MSTDGVMWDFVMLAARNGLRVEVEQVDGKGTIELTVTSNLDGFSHAIKLDPQVTREHGEGTAAHLIEWTEAYFGPLRRDV